MANPGQESASPEVVTALDTVGISNAADVRISPPSINSDPLEIAKGNVTGSKIVLARGRNSDIDSAAVENLWGAGGTYVAPTQARLHNVVSTSVNDTSAGTGARTVKITGLDSTYAEINETVTMNGTTDVATTNSFLRINEMKVLTAGTGNENAGVITATAQTDSTVSSYMEVNHNFAQQAIYTVPLGKTAYIVKGWAAIAKNGGSNPHVDIHFRVGNFNGIQEMAFVFGLQGEGTSNVQHVLSLPLKILEKIDMRLGADTTVNNTNISGGWDMILVDD